MAQREIMIWLTKKRVKSHKFYSIKEITEGNGKGGNVHRQVKQLQAYGFLERKFVQRGVWKGFHPVYRVRKSKILAEFVLEGDGDK